MGIQRVLVVDDESEQRRVYRRLLETHGLEVRSASSAAEALEITADGERCPHLILSDIAMPGMDGVSLLKILRSNPDTAEIPAILMTGLELPPGLMAAAAEALGVGPVHLKGGAFADLLARIQEQLRTPPRAKGVVVDPVQRTIWIDGRRLPALPARRFQLLCALLRQPRELSREELLDAVWDAKDNINVVDVTVLRLRRDLRDFPLLRIETVPAGYRLVIGGFPPRPT